MPTVRATVTVPAPLETVYRYLRKRYDSPAYWAASMATKGYVPRVRCLEADEPYRLSFFVAGRDPMLNVFMLGWRWEYALRPAAETATEVTICYRWGWLMSFLGAGTVRHQAANELVETVMALDALGWAFGAARPMRAGERPPPPSEAIRERRGPSA